jgi:hypothetical protein
MCRLLVTSVKPRSQQIRKIKQDVYAQWYELETERIVAIVSRYISTTLYWQSRAISSAFARIFRALYARYFLRFLCKSYKSSGAQSWLLTSSLPHTSLHVLWNLLHTNGAQESSILDRIRHRRWNRLTGQSRHKSSNIPLNYLVLLS